MFANSRQFLPLLTATAVSFCGHAAFALDVNVDLLDKAADGDVEKIVPSNSSESEPAAVAQPAAPLGLESTIARLKSSRTGKARLALTLAGGGSRGAAHIGVLKVLDREGIKPDFIAGSSVGGMIGALYASGLTANQIEKLALNGELKRAYFPLPRKVQSVIYSVRYGLCRMIFIHPKIGLYSGKSLAKFIEQHLPEGVENFEDLKIPFAVAAVNLVDTKPVWMSKGKISTAVRASNTVPFIYRPLGPKDGAQLVDAGIRDNLPTDIADAIGSPLVVAVKLHSYLEKVPQKEFDTNFAYADRITSIFMAEIENKGVAKADVLIEPKVQFMDMRSFNRKDMVRAIAVGEQAAEQALPEIKRRLGTGVARTESKPDL
jgi:NTE family protein